jgi:plastocyanin
MNMRRMLLAGAGAVLVAGALAASSLSAGKSVEVGDNYFVRDAGHATVTIKKGQAVTWKWSGRNPHTVTVASGPAKFSSKTITGKGRTYSHTFTKAGTYNIYCKIHGQSMTMKLVVK